MSRRIIVILIAAIVLIIAGLWVSKLTEPRSTVTPSISN